MPTRIPSATEGMPAERIVEAYLVAQAEVSGVREVLSVDRSIERIKTVARREP